MHVSMRLSDAEYSPYYILDTAVSSSEEGGPVLINYGRTTREKRELIHHSAMHAMDGCRGATSHGSHGSKFLGFLNAVKSVQHGTTLSLASPPWPHRRSVPRKLVYRVESRCCKSA